MSKKLARTAAGLISIAAAFTVLSGFSGGTANASEGYDCRDAIHFYWAASDGGYTDSANYWLSQIVGNGCIDSV